MIPLACEHGATAEELANKEQSTDPTSEAAIHMKVQSIDGDMHELDLQPAQTVADLKEFQEEYERYSSGN